MRELLVSFSIIFIFASLFQFSFVSGYLSIEDPGYQINPSSSSLVKPVTNHLVVDRYIYCHHPVRDTTGLPKLVVSSHIEYADGGIPKNDPDLRSAPNWNEKVESCSPRFWSRSNQDGDSCSNISSGFNYCDPNYPNAGGKSAIFTSLPTYTIGDGCFWSPAVKFEINTHNPFFLRYEGIGENSCFSYEYFVHEYWKNGKKVVSYASDGHVIPQGTSYEDILTRLPGKLYTVDWDNNKRNCIDLGGDYNSSLPAGDRCCGDDWIWVNNLQYNSSSYPKLPLNLSCLYGGSYYYDSSGYPHCSRVSSNLQYDSYLSKDNKKPSGLTVLSNNSDRFNLSNSYLPSVSSPISSSLYGSSGERLFASPGSKYWFAGVGSTEVDVGKHGSYYCYHYYNSSENKERFKWYSIEEGGELNQISCSLFLGYNWTGSKCCGNNFNESYNDPSSDCNSVIVALDVMSSGSFQHLASADFYQLFNLKCNHSLSRNDACWQSHLVENNSIVSSDNSSTKDLLQLNGVFYSCNGIAPANISITSWSYNNKSYYYSYSGIINLSDPLLNLSKNFFSCTVFSNYLCSSNKSWINLTMSSVEPAYSTFGFRGNKDSVMLSSVPDKASALPGITESNCCFSGSCWDGHKCVANGTAYQLGSGFMPYDNKFNISKDLYRCLDGSWHKLSVAPNWYYDLSTGSYCSEPSQCGCASGSSYSIDCGKNTEFGCTKGTNFFYKDHLCSYFALENSSVWTSRTSILAGLFLSLAESSDSFSLYCDKPVFISGNPVLSASVSGYTNSFCLLNLSSSVSGNKPEEYLGLSLNIPDSLSQPVSVYLFGSNGTAKSVFSELNGITSLSCPSLVLSGNSNFSFYLCNYTGSGYFYYNPAYKLLIYTKSSENSIKELSSSLSFSTISSLLVPKLEKLTSLIALNKASLSRQNYFNLNNSPGFSRLYYLKSGQKSVFGVIETKANNNAGTAQSAIKDFTAVLYTGFGFKCSAIQAQGLDCIQSDESIEAEASSTEAGSLALLDISDAYSGSSYWQDMTSKLRLG